MCKGTAFFTYDQGNDDSNTSKNVSLQTKLGTKHIFAPIGNMKDGGMWEFLRTFAQENNLSYASNSTLHHPTPLCPPDVGR